MTRAGAQEALRQKRRHLQIHRRAFTGAAVIALVAAVAVDGSGRFVWPFLIWGFALFLHYMYVRSLDVDEDWASNRAADVSHHAYDSGHIDITRKRYEDDTTDRQSGGSAKPPRRR